MVKNLHRISPLRFAFMMMLVCVYQTASGQLPLNTIGSPVVENFDGLGNAAAATLPSGFRVSNDLNANVFSNGLSVTTQSAGTSGAGILNGTSTGGVYNFADGVAGSATDRSLGFLSSGTFELSRSIMLEIQNNTGSPITSLEVSFFYEKYRSGANAFQWSFFHGNDGVNWNPEAGGDHSFTADANNTTVINPPSGIFKSFTITGLNIPVGTVYYLCWTYGGASSSNGQAIGIDDVSITPFTGPPGPQSNETDYFRSKQSGNWNATSTWESSSDNVNWINATLAPTLNAKTITVSSGHTVTIATPMSADELVIQAGALLIHNLSVQFDLNNGTGTDMIIFGTYRIFGTIPVNNGTASVESGGMVEVRDNADVNRSDDIAFASSNFQFKTGSIFNWMDNGPFFTNGVIYFQNIAEKPIFRISSDIIIGAGASTTINGILEINANVTWQHSGTKVFRDGIIGSGTLTQTSNSGPIQITSSTAVLGGAGPIELNTTLPSSGIQILNGATLEMISDKIINGTGIITVQSGSWLECRNFVLSGTANFVLDGGGKLGIGSPAGITSSGATGNIQTAGRTYSSNADYFYNGIVDQVTGGFSTTPEANRVNTLNIANTDNTVTLSPGNNQMRVFGLYLNTGFFRSGLNQTLRVENNGAVFGNGGRNPNQPEAGNIEFMGAGRTEGINTGNPFLYSVIINGPSDFNGNSNAHSATIMHRLQMNANSSVVDAPFYQSGSSLVYATGGVYGRNVEWGNVSGLQGYPHHVVVQGNTIVDLNTNGIMPAVLEIGGDLIIGNETGHGQVYMNNNMAKRLVVRGNLVIGNASANANGSILRLSNGFGGDLVLHGNFTRHSNGLFNDVGRAIFLSGSGNATINTPGVTISPGIPTQNFSYLLLAKDNRNVLVTLNCPVGILQDINFGQGVLVTSNTNLLVINNNATANGGSWNSFVSGPLRKIGNQAFVFPVGVRVNNSTNHFRTIGISAPANAGDAFTAQFYRAQPLLVNGSSPISNAALLAGLQRVSFCEYWDLERSSGSSNVSVTLSWATEQECNTAASYVTEPASLVVVPYQTGPFRWGDLFGRTSTSGAAQPATETLSTITWNGATTFNKFVIGTTSVSQNPLPLNLNSFLAKAVDNHVLLNWVVADNTMYSHYELEHSSDGSRFARFETVQPEAVMYHAAYVNVHHQPVQGWNFYRIRGVALNGEVRYSGIIRVWFGTKGMTIQLHPNPVSEKMMVNLQDPGSVREIQVVNISGQVLQSIVPREFITVIPATNLKAGTYYLRFIRKTGVTVKPFIKL